MGKDGCGVYGINIFMLNHSNTNLFNSILNFVNNSTNTNIFSAYIKTNVIEKLNNENKINQIIVRWEINDLVNNVSDLDLFQYCKIHNIKLFRNTRLHLKAIINNKNEVIFGSSNYTNNGMAIGDIFNFELNSDIQLLSSQDLFYLNKILKESEYIDDNKFEKIKNEVEKYKHLKINIPELPSEKSVIDKFLISQLPMSKSIESLYEFYKNGKFDTIENQNCFIHDLTLFDIDDFDMTFDSFIIFLTNRFNENIFIKTLKSFIKNERNSSLRYGGVVDWIHENTTTVPTPLNWEIKKMEIVNILYYWITTFDKEFKVTIPGQRSEVITYMPIK